MVPDSARRLSPMDNLKYSPTDSSFSSSSSVSGNMSGSSHDRNPSADSVSSIGSHSSYRMILDHVMDHPGQFEISLRNMYILNCAPRAQALDQLRNSPSPTGQPAQSPDAHSTTQQLTSSLRAQMAHLPSQPTSLPPKFLTKHISKWFPFELEDVDFPQALTGMDYLKMLETQRRKEVADALRRLGIEPSALGTDEDDFSRKYPGVAEWVRGMEEKEKKVDAQYTQLYVGLRRWLLINEMSHEPFRKLDCIAMLNTLYPPLERNPTSGLTLGILNAHRKNFFNYIRIVEEDGPGVLKGLMGQHREPGEKTAWPAVHRAVMTYLDTANSIITECREISVGDTFGVIDEYDRRDRRKADSGVSFGSTERPAEQRRPSTANSISSKDQTPPDQPALKHKRSKLERITSGFNKLRPKASRSRLQATEMYTPEPEAEPEPVPELPTSSHATLQPLEPQLKPPKEKTLRKSRSFGGLEKLRSKNGSTASVATQATLAPEVPAFNQEEMSRRRREYMASQANQPPNQNARRTTGIRQPKTHSAEI